MSKLVFIDEGVHKVLRGRVQRKTDSDIEFKTLDGAIFTINRSQLVFLKEDNEDAR